MRNRKNCVYYNKGYCVKGLPGTKCILKGCVAFYPKEDGFVHNRLSWNDEWCKHLATITNLGLRYCINNHPNCGDNCSFREPIHEPCIISYISGENIKNEIERI